MASLNMKQLKDQVSALLDSKGNGLVGQTFYNHMAGNDGITIDRMDVYRFLVKYEPNDSYTLSVNTPIHRDQNYHYLGNNTSLDVITDWMLA